MRNEAFSVGLHPVLPAANQSYIPTCSSYAVTAITRYGALKGGLMAAWRVLRCNPFSKGGYDPVPEDPLVTFRRE